MKTISFINIKGGVAKTTSAIAFAQLLALEQGKRVLVVDNDKQANATLSLLGNLPEDVLTTADLLTSKTPIAEEAILPTAHGVDLIPAGFSLVDANRTLLFATNQRDLRYKFQLETVADRYDYCIIDNPPDVDLGVINALIASDHVMVPIRADRYGFNGLNYTFNAIEEAQNSNPSLSIAGCFLTMLCTGTNLAGAAKDLLATCGEKLACKASIRHSTRVGESTFGAPLISAAPQSNAADDYRALLREYMERTGA